MHMIYPNTHTHISSPNNKNNNNNTHTHTSTPTNNTTNNSAIPMSLIYKKKHPPFTYLYPSYTTPPQKTLTSLPPHSHILFKII